MFTLIGPGRYSAMSAAVSSKDEGARARSSARIGGDSSWNTPMVVPAESRSKVAWSSSEMASMSTTSPRNCSMTSTVSVMTSRFRRPRKSILSRPSSSTPPISYWVTTGASSGACPDSGLRWIGRYSVSGSLVITTAAAWMPSWRRRPSRPLATSITLRASSSVSYIVRRSVAMW